jgi:hypothetical protein
MPDVEANPGNRLAGAVDDLQLDGGGEPGTSLGDVGALQGRVEIVRAFSNFGGDHAHIRAGDERALARPGLLREGGAADERAAGSGNSHKRERFTTIDGFGSAHLEPLLKVMPGEITLRVRIGRYKFENWMQLW